MSFSLSVIVSPINRSWNILCWNVRGINAAEKWSTICNKIDESNCEIFCFQETKKENFDSAFIRNFAPRRFDKFAFAPSVGASGGSLYVGMEVFFMVLLWISSTLPLQLVFLLDLI